MRAGARNTTSVVLARVTVAGAEVPIRTRAPAGSASPVMVTSVPPSVLTRAGLSEVIRKVPTAGESMVPPSSRTGAARRGAGARRRGPAAGARGARAGARAAGAARGGAGDGRTRAGGRVPR